ncbi:TOG array regulator of axonemal microtubules protein 2 isoform X2 [Pleurodeles waltl]|uniref:TOG array regulator of axonemal microtubules protein 2 isoform X2 n=1 Tax=Pleurodeles waltl TaxID=8319 RepID=UPI003709C091
MIYNHGNRCQGIPSPAVHFSCPSPRDRTERSITAPGPGGTEYYRPWTRRKRALPPLDQAEGSITAPGPDGTEYYRPWTRRKGALPPLDRTERSITAPGPGGREHYRPWTGRNGVLPPLDQAEGSITASGRPRRRLEVPGEYGEKILTAREVGPQRRPSTADMARHDDIAAAKFRATVAVYCGSVPKMKPGYHSLRTGSMDSNLHLCGNKWMAADIASYQTSLSVQMKPTLSGGIGDQVFSGTVLPTKSWETRNSYQSLALKRELLQPPSPPLKLDPREQEVGSAALETARLKDKVKRKMSEGPGHQGVESSSPNDGVLIPPVPRSASQRTLNALKPVPPIQKSPTPQTNGAEGSGQDAAPNGSTRETEATEGHSDQSLAPKEVTDVNQVQNSLQYVRSSAEKKRKSLSGTLIPPIPKSGRSSLETGFEDCAVSPQGSEDKTHITMEMQRSTTRRSATESDVEQRSLERKTLDSVLPVQKTKPADVMKLTEVPAESAPLKTIFLNPAKEEDRIHLQQNSGEEEGKENNGRINFTISKSAQDKMRQKRMEEMEYLTKERDRQWSHLQLRDRLQNMDPGGIIQNGHADTNPFYVNGLSPAIASMDTQRASAGVTLRKRVNRPSLPNFPTVSQDVSDSRHPSAHSLPANSLTSRESDADLENPESMEIRPFSHPEQGLIDALKCLHHKDWEQKEKGLRSVRCLASCHSHVLFSRLHDVTLAVTKEVSNLRSKVSRHAIRTLGELFKTLKRNMDQEVEEVARVLLHKIGDSNEFIREEADRSLMIMVENVSPSKALAALIAGGVNHRNSSVRKCSGEHLLSVVELLGAERLLSGSKDGTDMLLRTIVKLAQDAHQDTRYYGRKMLSVLMPHPRFDGLMERSVCAHDLREIMTTIKNKGMGESTSEPPSAKSHRTSWSNSFSTSQDSLPSDEGVDTEAATPPQLVPRRQVVRSAEVTEQLKELNKLMTAKEFQSRTEGVTLLLEHCKNNPKFVTANIMQIFDCFNPRLQDSNKKVNQYALESTAVMIPILKDSLHQVLVSMVIVVTDNLNSKHAGIYSAAVKVLDTLIAHIDNLWLLQPFASRVPLLSGRAMNDITERLSVLVSAVYPRKPQAVERHVLPVLWYFLSNMTGSGVLPGKPGNVKAVVSKLTEALMQQMGVSLEEYASSQPQHVVKALQELSGRKL